MAWVSLCTLAFVTATGMRWTLHRRLGALPVVHTHNELRAFSAEYIPSDLVFVEGICPCSGLWIAAPGEQRETRWVFNYSLHHTQGYDCAGYRSSIADGCAGCPVIEGGTQVKVEYCCCLGGGCSWSGVLGDRQFLPYNSNLSEIY